MWQLENKLSNMTIAYVKIAFNHHCFDKTEVWSFYTDQRA